MTHALTFTRKKKNTTTQKKKQTKHLDSFLFSLQWHTVWECALFWSHTAFFFFTTVRFTTLNLFIHNPNLHNYSRSLVSVMRQTWGKSDCRSKTNVSTSNYYLVPQKVATSIISNKAQKRERKLFPLKIEETNLFCHLRQKQATEYNQATKEDIPAPNDVWLKQITPITTVVASLVHMKSKRWT